MPESFPWAYELAKAVGTVAALLVFCLCAGAVLSVVQQWPNHWQSLVEWLNERKRKRLATEWNPRAEAMRTFHGARVVSLSQHKQQATAKTSEPIRRQAHDLTAVIRTDTGSFGG